VTGYQHLIRRVLANARAVDTTDPRHVEAWMRLERGCLDGLSRSRFASEVEIALECIAAGPTAQSESLAQSFGF